MMSSSSAITLTAALLAGLAGSAHCFAMCGGMAGALGIRAERAGKAAYLDAATYQVGRISGYALGGLAFGVAGAALQSAFDLIRISAALRVMSGALLLAIAVRLLAGWNGLAAIERWGASFWRLIQPLVHRASRINGGRRALLLGLLWGWLPCGLVYSMLAVAATSGSGVYGAATMAAFGVGTAPAMMTSTVLASRLQSAMRRRWPRLVSGGLLLTFGLWTIVSSFGHAPAAHVH